MIHPEFYKTLYINALTPFEILELSKKHDCKFRQINRSTHMELWRNSISKENSEEAFNRYREYNELSFSQLDLISSKLESIQGEVQFPDWIESLRLILENCHEIEYTNQHSEKPFFDVLSPFIRFIIEQLKINLQQEGITPPGDLIIEKIETAIHKDLFSISQQVLFQQFSRFKGNPQVKIDTTDPKSSYYAEFVKDLLENQYQQLFINYPMLARKFAIKSQSYLKFITSIFTRYSADKFEVAYYFDNDFGKLTDLHINAGDQHNGESTAILEFERGDKLVYKPTNVSVTIAYNNFLDWVNEQIDAGLQSFKVIDKEDYGWLEFVENSSCNNIEDIHNYYERAGMLSGIAYFLNAKDFHCENLIASGNSPVLIDHETIIGPSVKLFTSKDASQEVLGTVLESLLLPPINQNIPPHVCGFGSSVHLSNQVAIPKIRNCNTDEMTITTEVVEKSLFRKNKPRLNGEIKNLVNYQEEFKKGFQKLYLLILDKKEALLSDTSPLNCFKDVKIRFVNRQTVVYFNILNFLNKPEYLADATTYGLKLEILARAYSTIGNWSPLLASERKQMLEGNMPVFYTNSLSKNLMLENGEIANAIDLSAIEIVKKKIEKALPQDFDKQMGLIEKVIEL